MSANNWGECPDCTSKAVEDRNTLLKKVQESYGKIPIDEFIKIKSESEKPVKQKSTLREDYELGMMRSRKFYMIYRASCTECGFDVSFKDEKDLPPRKKT